MNEIENPMVLPEIKRHEKTEQETQAEEEYYDSQLDQYRGK